MKIPALKSLELKKDDEKLLNKLENKISSLKTSVSDGETEFNDLNNKIDFLTQKLPDLKKTADMIEDEDSKRLYDSAVSKKKDLEKERVKVEKDLVKSRNDLEKFSNELKELKSNILTDLFFRANIALWQSRYELYNGNGKVEEEYKELRDFVRTGFPVQFRNDRFVDTRLLK